MKRKTYLKSKPLVTTHPLFSRQKINFLLACNADYSSGFPAHTSHCHGHYFSRSFFQKIDDIFMIIVIIVFFLYGAFEEKEEKIKKNTATTMLHDRLFIRSARVPGLGAQSPDESVPCKIRVVHIRNTAGPRARAPFVVRDRRLCDSRVRNAPLHTWRAFVTISTSYALRSLLSLLLYARTYDISFAIDETRAGIQ